MTVNRLIRFVHERAHSFEYGIMIRIQVLISKYTLEHQYHPRSIEQVWS